MDYPAPDIELRIISTHIDVSGLEDELMKVIKLANDLRRSAAEGELEYSPSIRETLTYAKLRKAGVDIPLALKVVFIDVYGQYSEFSMRKVKELIGSVFGYGVVDGVVE